MYGYIYKTTNLVNNKIYIGQHKSQTFDTHYKGSGVALQEAFKEFGKSNFKCNVIEWCEDAKQLNDREAYWIAFYKTTDNSIGYNRATYGTTCSERQKRIVSEYMRNRVISKNTRLKMSNSAKSRSNSMPSNRDKIWVNDGVKEFLITPTDSTDFNIGRLPNEYTKGGAKDKYSNGCYIHKGDETLFVSNELVEKFLSDGYEMGKGKNNYSEQRNQKLKQSKSGTVAITDGNKTFYIKPDLLDEYLDKGFVKGTYQAFNRNKDK